MQLAITPWRRLGAVAIALLASIAFAAPAQAQTSALPPECSITLAPCAVDHVNSTVVSDSGINPFSTCRRVHVARVGVSSAGAGLWSWNVIVNWCFNPATRIITSVDYSAFANVARGWAFDRFLRYTTRYGPGMDKFVFTTEALLRLCNPSRCQTASPQIQFVVRDGRDYVYHVDF